MLLGRLYQWPFFVVIVPFQSSLVSGTKQRTTYLNIDKKNETLALSNFGALLEKEVT